MLDIHPHAWLPVRLFEAIQIQIIPVSSFLPREFLFSTEDAEASSSWAMRKTLTVISTEISKWVERPEGSPEVGPDLRVLGAQALNLTKLNWASTDSFCGQPITLKYAGSIAYLTAAFLRRSEPFNLHPVLERTPWFI